MDQETADRIIALALKWQDPGHWTVAYNAAESWRKASRQSSESAAEAWSLLPEPIRQARNKEKADEAWKLLQEDPSQREMRDLMKQDATLCKDAAKIHHDVVVAAHQEFADLAALVFENSPALFALVPRPDFVGEPSAQQEAMIQSLRELAGAVKSMPPLVRSPEEESRKDPGRKKTLGERMAEIYTTDRSSAGWTSEEWAKQLDCDSSAIRKTKTWKAILIEGEARKQLKIRDYTQGIVK